jgi:hypothetical protein
MMASTTALPAIVERLIEKAKKKNPDIMKKPKEPKPVKPTKRKKACSLNSGWLH